MRWWWWKRKKRKRKRKRRVCIALDGACRRVGRMVPVAI